MRKLCILLVCFATAFGSLSLSTCFGNLVENGSFEQPYIASDPIGIGYPWAWFPTGSPELAPWRIGGPGDVAVAAYPSDQPCSGVHSGRQALDFGGGNGIHGAQGPGEYIEQDIPTLIGGTYQLSYYVGLNGAPGVGIQADVFDSNENTIASLGSSSPSTHTWIGYTLDFCATSSTTRIRFTDLGNNSVGDAMLDSVSVVATSVPEPSTFILFSMGLLGLIAYVGKRRKLAKNCCWYFI